MGVTGVSSVSAELFYSVGISAGAWGKIDSRNDDADVAVGDKASAGSL